MALADRQRELWGEPPPTTSPVAFSTADISIQLLKGVTNALQEIHSHITACSFGAVHKPEQGPAVRQVLEELLEVLESSSPDGLL